MYDRLLRALEAAGVPDRYGIVGGLRVRIAEMLVASCRSMGEDRFRGAVAEVLEATVEAARADGRHQAESP